jgi:lipopolysaccharide transport protein LptA
MATIAAAGTGTVVITSQQVDWTLGADKSSHGNFTGGVRLMQSPNLLRADQVAINATAQTLTATGHVTTNLAQNGKPVTIAAGNLRFEQAKHTAIYNDGVKLSSAQGTLAAPKLAVQLNPKGGLESGLASGGVELTQVGRVAKAEQVDYDFKQQRIVLSGGSPSITDAEHGEVSGDPLTFLMASDEIQVGGKPGARVKGVTKATGQIPHNGRQ